MTEYLRNGRLEVWGTVKSENLARVIYEMTYTNGYALDKVVAYDDENCVVCFIK